MSPVSSKDIPEISRQTRWFVLRQGYSACSVMVSRLSVMDALKARVSPRSLAKERSWALSEKERGTRTSGNLRNMSPFSSPRFPADERSWASRESATGALSQTRSGLYSSSRRSFSRNTVSSLRCDLAQAFCFPSNSSPIPYRMVRLLRDSTNLMQFDR